MMRGTGRLAGLRTASFDESAAELGNVNVPPVDVDVELARRLLGNTYQENMTFCACSPSALSGTVSVF